MSMFDELVKDIGKKYKGAEDKIIYDPNREFEKLSSGSEVLDIFSGGGLALRRGCVELLGMESSGKTTLAMQTAREVIKSGGAVVYWDVERTFSADYAKSLGLDVNSERFVVLQPRSAEEFDSIRGLIKERGLKIDLMVVDSVAALQAESMLNNEIGSSQAIGQHAAMWGQLAIKMKLYASMSDCAVMYINQLRAKPMMGKFDKFTVLGGSGVGFGNSNTDVQVSSTGGYAFRYYLDARYLLGFASSYQEKVEDFYDGEEEKIISGNFLTIKNIKSKVNAPYRKGKFLIRFGVGTDDLPIIFDMGKTQGLIEGKGAWFTYKPHKGEELRGNGQKDFLRKLKAAPEVQRDLVNVLREKKGLEVAFAKDVEDDGLVEALEGKDKVTDI